jgi:hypothetical protein
MEVLVFKQIPIIELCESSGVGGGLVPAHPYNPIKTSIIIKCLNFNMIYSPFINTKINNVILVDFCF